MEQLTTEEISMLLQALETSNKHPSTDIGNILENMALMDEETDIQAKIVMVRSNMITKHEQNKENAILLSAKLIKMKKDILKKECEEMTR